MRNLQYRWVMIIISVGILATAALPIFTFGVFFTPLTTEFDWDRGALSGAYSMYLLLTGILSILMGRLSDKYGPRILVTLYGLLTAIGFLLLSQINSLWQVYLIWGFFMGIGASCCFAPVMSTIPRWFAKRTGIAVGIIMAGLSLGAVISPLLAQWLISTYDWRQAFITLGLVIFIIVVPLAQFMKHSPQWAGLKAYGQSQTIEDKQSSALAIEGVPFARAIKTSQFWFFASINFLFFFCLQVVIVHIIPYAVDIEIPAVVAASMLSIIAGSSVIGKLSMGFISDRIGSRLSLIVCLIISTLALIWLLFAEETWMLYIFAVVFGLAYGGIVPLIVLVPVELFGHKFLGIIFGSLIFFGTLGEALGPPLAGSIFDVTGSYRLAFLISVILCALAVIPGLILLRSKGVASGK